ncbi:GNAT family N-acetyltransferase [Embleya scabrispora]|uniref:GNAT family N-acetyltransferase n=1 Tax=Embleya scabrispora TaxID=159449 RepID=UPI00039BB36E|nr:GNAT family N-acetyltransferase [Embleya scabrispora]MYS86724.1 GNAT family N-acetyltransferase [Streptomyces sp. SID5474]
MPALTVRPFHRDDRDQLTDLVNAHVAAVVPGVSVSVNTVLGQLTRRPDEFVTDPWVAERVTLVAEQLGSVVAAAHLLRYRDDAEVGPDLRGAGEIAWFVYRPPASFRPDSEAAADQLMAACLARLARWDVRVRYADGTLPAPGVYGLPDVWPHVRAVYERAGFRHTGHTEVVLLAEVADLLSLPTEPSLPRPAVRRTLGECGTRLTAHLDGRVLGFVEVDTALDRPERLARNGALADIGSLVVEPDHRVDGLRDWLLAQAAQWLRLAGVDRVLAYESADDADEIGRLTAAGFRELTRTDRGWEHRQG